MKSLECRLIAEYIEQALGCGKHLVHAELAFLTSNFGGQLTRRGGMPRDIATVDNRTMALESLPRRHSSEPDCQITALGAVSAN